MARYWPVMPMMLLYISICLPESHGDDLKHVPSPLSDPTAIHKPQGFQHLNGWYVHIPNVSHFGSACSFALCVTAPDSFAFAIY
jgi:hypothetical protein